VAEKKIAVVVVHGVANQQPSQSAREIANLLTDLCPPGTYTTFQEEKIRIRLEPVKVDKGKPVRRSLFEERNDDALQRHRGEPVNVDPEHGFMRDQLRGYDVKDRPRVFETVRLDGVRNESECTVHVYEAYWADLSRLGGGIVAFFGALYQLLLHLPSLGRNAVDYARAEDKGGRLWPLFSWFHRWSIRWLTLFIVVINLVLASLILPALAPRLTRQVQAAAEKHQDFKRIEGCCGLPSIDAAPVPRRENLSIVDVVTRTILALMLIGLTAALLLHRRPPAWLWAVAPIIAAVAGVFLAQAIASSWGAGRLLVLEAWVLSAGLIGVLLAQYNKMRRGALPLGVIGLVATLLMLFKFLNEGDGEELALTAAVLHALQYVVTALQIAWRIHIPWLFLTIVIGLLCAATASRRWRQHAWNTTWTARISLTLSTALFANLTLALWAALFTGVKSVLPDGTFTPKSMGPVIDRLFCLNSATMAPAAWLESTLMTSVSRAFIYITATFALFVLAAVWAIFPSVLAETKPPQQDPGRARMRALGVWLTRGLHFIPAATELFGVLLLLLIIRIWTQTVGCRPPEASSAQAISAAIALLAALLSARFLPGAGAALDVILDVDNYLRQHPKSGTPRATIAERCASLYRFILDPKQCGHNYSSVVFIAHSQGTIITADLLRFLHKEGDAIATGLAAKKPAFFTMGNPLRQIYARAFPGLFPWVWKDHGPNPGDLGVTEWVNAYRSGDYVGRIITGKFEEKRWDRRDRDPQDKETPTIVTGNDIQEMCIGEGAHTHYWDHHGDDIAVKLDELIAVRCRRQP
jgi:hypothetical protein